MLRIDDVLKAASEIEGWLLRSPEHDEREIFVEIRADRFQEIEELLLQGTEDVGYQHKQWILCEIADRLGTPLPNDVDRGIAP